MSKRAYTVDRETRAARRGKVRTVTNRHGLKSDKDTLIIDATVERSDERAELTVVISAMSRAFKGTIDFYKADYGGGFSHAEAVKGAEEMQEARRKWVKEGMPIERIGWTEMSALAEVSLPEAMDVWVRVKEAAVAELESGRRLASVLGDTTAWAYASFLAIREAFADEWQPRGGIEAAMIDMMAVAFSLQMHWASIGHQRATHFHDKQEKDLGRFEIREWKSPYQGEADAVEQAHRFADGYNRQFLRVLRQLRDLRRYAPPVIVNNGGQVNLATDGGQQVNVSK
jgi:hypothetical protein